MRLGSKVLAVGTAALIALGTAGCSSMAEKVLEEALGKAGVEVDVDQGSVSIDTDDGAVTIEADGKVPEDFPSGIPLPNAKLSASSTFPGMWTLHYDGADRATVDALVGELESAGYEQASILDHEEMMQATFRKDDLIASIIWSDESGSPVLIYGVMQESDE